MGNVIKIFALSWCKLINTDYENTILTFSKLYINDGESSSSKLRMRILQPVHKE